MIEIFDPVLLIAGAWALIFSIAAFYLSAIAPGPRRQRLTKQFLVYVVPTMFILTLLFLRTKGLI